MNETFEQKMVFSHMQRYCIMTPSGDIISFEDGHYTTTKEVDIIVKNGLFFSRRSAEDSLAAIRGAWEGMFVAEIEGTVNLTFRQVDPYTMEDIIAKAKKAGLTDDDISILMEAK